MNSIKNKEIDDGLKENEQHSKYFLLLCCFGFILLFFFLGIFLNFLNFYLKLLGRVQMGLADVGKNDCDLTSFPHKASEVPKSVTIADCVTKPPNDMSCLTFLSYKDSWDC